MRRGREPRPWPWWLRALLGLLCAVVGTVIVFRPFASLSVLVVAAAAAAIATGVATLASSHRVAAPWPWLIGLGWILAGVLLVAWPGLTTRGLAIFVGIAMIVGGVAELVAGVIGTTDERLDATIGGAASVIFGLLALAWPDVTLLVVAVIFGARTILFGLRTLFAAVRDRGRVPEPAAAWRPPGRRRRRAHALGPIVALVLGLALAGVSAALNVGEPVVDDFYAAPADVPSQPGVLLRSEPYSAGIPSSADAWRILYTTTRDEGGEPAVASAVVVAPDGPSAGPRPVVAWAHGTTGIDEMCAPSVLGDLGAGAFHALDRVIDEGWAVVATDYVGLGTEGPHPYLIGQGEARSVLDAVRAAKQMDELVLANQTVVWGHSQGGGAALWTGTIAPTYAPDAFLVGVAALAPTGDLLGLAQNLENVRGGSVFAAFALSAYADAYADVRLDDYVEPTARGSFDEITERCLTEPSDVASIASSLPTGLAAFSQDLASGPLAARLQANVPVGPVEAPLLIAQGEADALVLVDVQAAFVQRLCDSGQPVDFRTYPGLDHGQLVEEDSPLIADLVSWTQDRFEGIPAGSTCPTV